ncbi:MAG TPA: hypothetical protein VNH11_17035 [Pirellulales bacterium]|nr:hypothetical protein [Pirellulales bacterium]
MAAPVAARAVAAVAALWQRNQTASATPEARPNSFWNSRSVASVLLAKGEKAGRWSVVRAEALSSDADGWPATHPPAHGVGKFAHTDETRGLWLSTDLLGFPARVPKLCACVLYFEYKNETSQASGAVERQVNAGKISDRKMAGGGRESKIQSRRVGSKSKIIHTP